MLSRIIRRLRGLYYRSRMSTPIWQILNLGAIRHFKQQPPQLTSAQQKILISLKRDGIATAHIQDLLPDSLWNEFKAYIDARITSQEVQQSIATRRLKPTGRGDKYYNITLVENPRLDLKNPMFRSAIHESVLGIVNSYFGLWTKFRGIRLWASLPVSQGAARHASQNWHRDPEDRKIIKTFIYFNDVDQDTGPFTYIKGSHEGGKWRYLYPQIPPLGSYAPAGALDDIIPPEDIFEGTGPTGTIIFCDTSGLHRGGYCKKNTRYMYLGVYASKTSVEPLGYIPTPADLSTLPQVSRYALENAL